MGCRRDKGDHTYQPMVRPFICSDCNIHYAHTNYIWIHQKCQVINCQHMICAKCRLENENEQVLK